MAKIALLTGKKVSHWESKASQETVQHISRIVSDVARIALLTGKKVSVLSNPAASQDTVQHISDCVSDVATIGLLTGKKVNFAYQDL